MLIVSYVLDASLLLLHCFAVACTLLSWLSSMLWLHLCCRCIALLWRAYFHAGCYVCFSVSLCEAQALTISVFDKMLWFLCLQH